MHRTDAAGYAAGNLFTDGNPSTGIPATVVDAAWLNDIQENLAQVIEAAGIGLSKGDYTQLLKAIVTKGMQGCYFNIGTASGTADAITSSYSPAIAALTNGMTLYVRAGSANTTTTPTFTPASGTIAAKTIVKGAGSALAAGDIAGGGHWIELQYDLTLDKWVLLNPATGVAVQVVGNVGQLKNLVINGGSLVAQRPVANLSTTAAYGQVDRFAAWGAGTAVSAGTITQDTASAIGRTAAALKLAGVTITGSGIVYARHRIESAVAKRLKNQIASFSALVYHDVGSSINYTVTIRKPTVADNFTSTTTIQAGSATPVASATGAQLTLANVSMGDCSNGIEIEISAACGAVTTKNFSYTEWQLEESASVSTFERRDFDFDLAKCQRYYSKSYDYAAAPGTATRNGLVGGGTNMAGSIYVPITAKFNSVMRVAPTVQTWDGAGNSGKGSDYSSAVWHDALGSNSVVSVGSGSMQVLNNTASYYGLFIHYTADAEL